MPEYLQIDTFSYIAIKKEVWTVPALGHNSTTKNKGVASSITVLVGLSLIIIHGARGTNGSNGSASGDSPHTSNNENSSRKHFWMGAIPINISLERISSKPFAIVAAK